MQLHNHYSVCLYNRPVHLRCRPWRGQQGLWGQGSGRVWKEVQLQVSGAGVSQEYFKGKAGRFQGVGHPRWRHSSPGGEGDGGGGCEDSGHERGVGRGGEGPRWGGLVLDNLPLPFREEIQQLPPLRRQRQGWVESLTGPSEALAGKGVHLYNKVILFNFDKGSMPKKNPEKVWSFAKPPSAPPPPPVYFVSFTFIKYLGQ